MGVRNLRAICPACGGKIHTQPKGLGHFSLWANSWMLVQTGDHCQHCGVALTGKVGPDNGAVLAVTSQPGAPLPPPIAGTAPPPPPPPNEPERQGSNRSAILGAGATIALVIAVFWVLSSSDGGGDVADGSSTGATNRSACSTLSSLSVKWQEGGMSLVDLPPHFERIADQADTAAMRSAANDAAEAALRGDDTGTASALRSMTAMCD